ncbi:hypothetical protein WOSG25_060420 [Weissella oryzae SG25]|uniref:DUF1934 domain-containing protein n=1 Tax=Weissella oryzae (strain DSM 25784 / JCM 18191 / LMG 30913 / SG25) TaxID=1329250 RepID=A0A069CTV5_WEIOS|nr:DUF1934 domain-containing protein [Weissella oryzae]GAK30924.1 hypothetical protein WOSG25_060420 [Weissella oryzae SG25]
MSKPEISVPVTVNIKTSINQADEFESFSFTENGKIVKIGNVQYLRYVEHGQDGTATPVTFKISPNGNIQLSRHSSSDVHINFVLTDETLTRYPSPAGNIILKVNTTAIKQVLTNNPQTGEIHIKYTLASDDDVLIGNYEVNLTFVENN